MPAFDGDAFDVGSAVTPSSFVFNDPFDEWMNKTCEILENQGTADSYGQKSNQVQSFPTIATVPCRVSTDAIGRPHEFKVEKKSSLAYSRIFMRPPVLPGGAKLDSHHWLKIDGDFYDIFEVENPAGLDHHYEVIAELITP